jgi:hypothetical protein
MRWLCTSISTVSMDGGWSNRITGEFAFNEYGWESRSVYTSPITRQPALLGDADTARVADPFEQGLVVPDVLTPLYKVETTPDPKASNFITESFYKRTNNAGSNPYGGAGRWCQQINLDMTKLIGFLSQGRLAKAPDDPKKDLFVIEL